MARARPAFEMRETFDPDGTLSLTLVGELDWTFCDDVEARLRGLQDAECEVRFDLSQLEFLDSAGVRALLRGLEGARCHGRPVAVGTHVNGSVEQTVTRLGIGRYLWPEEAHLKEETGQTRGL
ncbi:MAG: STAS domain-containing protein [Solirubrobacterales bacterium]|nr:STAS domain-containing protein [Solirubrobacterales bacterium]